MSGRVCVVIEHCEAWDDYEAEVKAVAGNPTIAENLIERYKNERVNKTYSEGGTVTDITRVGGDVEVLSEIPHGRITYRFYHSWTIEQFDIIES